MDVVELVNRFQFNKDLFLNENVGNVVADDRIVVVDLDRELLLYVYMAPAKFMRKGVFIDLLKKSAAQYTAHAIRASNNALCQSVKMCPV